jgi:hypothetical protein
LDVPVAARVANHSEILDSILAASRDRGPTFPSVLELASDAMKRRIPPYLKNKYPPVADFMSGSGFKIEHFHVEKRMRVSRICNSKLRSDQSPQASNLSNPDKIQVGQQVKIPDA